MSRSIRRWFSVLFVAQKVEGLIGNPEKIGRKGSRKPRWEEVRVWRRRRWYAMLNIVGHFEILFNNVVMWKEVSRKVVKKGF